MPEVTQGMKNGRPSTLHVQPIEDGTEDFDLEFWQAQGPAAIFAAAWEMAVLAHKMKGGTEDELRLRRTPVVVQPIRH
ncbi:MAG: hypothetical protein WCK51_02145 [Armatimonadota bacterium]